ncbi:MAG TPA: prolyl oligopeptidase family serine peptidase [Steroidobacteraceae bacterium]|nr:prolyl oligopeptidase family serine peptidase [Steroidobacteraceae bacterium]
MTPERLRWIVPACAAALLGACLSAQVGNREPLPGPGPGGKPMRTATDTAIGLPPAATAPVYPVTARVDVADNFFGTRVADPYRWLENLGSPAVQQWVAAQNAVSRPRLDAIPQRRWLKARLSELWNYERFDVPVRRGGHYFYLHNDGRQNQSVLFDSGALDSPGRVLFDPNAVRADATVAISEFAPDDQGDLVAYAVSDGGTDWQVWRFRRVSDESDLADTLHHTKFWGVSWAHDGSGVYYSRYPALADGKGDDSGRPSLYFHRLGTAQEDDRLVYAVTDHPTRIPSGRVTDDGRYLVITEFDGYEKNGVDLLDLRSPRARVTPLFAAWDALYTFIGSRGDELYFRTTKDAPRGRVIAVDARAPATWRTVVPEASAALEEASYVGGRFIARYVEDAYGIARLYERDGRPAGEVPLPGKGGIDGFRGKGRQTETFFGYTDFLTPRRIYRLDVPTNQVTLWRAPQLPVSGAAYLTEQVFYTSKDGTRVPMYITHRRDLARDGNQPTLLYGYGGFDISLTPQYRPAVQAWLEMGGVYAEANLRGGGEYGEAWHKAGTLVHKQQVFDDFIAAAEYLIDQHYTRSARLGIYGRSNGGLLVGAVLTQRPDLFGAALPAVGVLDMLRYQTASANARQWSSDYGLAEASPQLFNALYAYSPYQNVKKGTCYPPTLVTTADHDDRVVPWHSYKFAAALQAAQACPNPILIMVETRAGHGAGKPVWMQVDDYADQWAFLAKWLVVPAPGSAAEPARPAP